MKNTNRFLLLLALSMTAMTAVAVARVADPLVLTAPNGGEQIAPGDSIAIEWRGGSQGEPVRILYSSDAGASWSVVAARASGGRHGWRAPVEPTGDARIRVERWRADSVAGVRQLPRTRGLLKGMVYTPDGRRIVIGLMRPGHPADSEVEIRDASSLELVARRLFRGRTVFDLDVDPDGRRIYVASLAAGASDTSVIVLDVESAAVVGGLRGHAQGAASIDVSPDGRLVATGGYGPEVRVWEVATMTEVKRLDGFGGSVGQVAFDPTSRLLATGTSTSEGARIYSTESWTELRRIAGDTSGEEYGPVRHLEFSNDGSRLLMITPAYGAIIVDAATGDQMLRRRLPPGTSFGSFAPDGMSVATGRDTVHVWDAASGATRFVLPAPVPGLAGLAHAPDGAELMTLGRDSIPRLWLFDGPAVESDESDRSFGVGMPAGVDVDGGVDEAGTGRARARVDAASRTIEITRESHDGAPASIMVVALDGRVVASADLDGFEEGVTIDASRLAAGRYVVVVRASARITAESILLR